MKGMIVNVSVIIFERSKFSKFQLFSFVFEVRGCNCLKKTVIFKPEGHNFEKVPIDLEKSDPNVRKEKGHNLAH